MPKIRDLGIKVIPETMRPPEAGGGGGCTDCTVQAFSICGTTPGPGGCSDCTVQQFSICGTTPGPGGGCTDCTFKALSLCGGTHQGCGNLLTNCICTAVSPCVCSALRSIPCLGGTCGRSNLPWQQGELTREQVASLRDQLQKQMDALDEHAKTIGPKTAEEIDAREKAINEELAELKARRKNLK